MQDLTYRQEKIQEKRKQTSFRDFLMEIASWRPLNFYKNRGTFSRYPATSRSPKLASSEVFEQERYGYTKFPLAQESTNFFENIHQLFLTVPVEATTQVAVGGNTTFADVCRTSKNIYLSNFVVADCENVLYSMSIRENCTNIYNTIMAFDGCDNIYQSAGIIRSYNIFFSQYLQNCSDIRYSKNLLGCHFCIGCSNLENKSYYINNQPYTKEEYWTEFPKWKEKYTKEAPTLIATDTNMGSTNIQGSFVTQSDSVENGYFSYNQHNARNIFFAGSGRRENRDMYDVFIGGAAGGDDYYGVHGLGDSSNIYCSAIGTSNTNLYYSFCMNGCNFCLGCIGLKNASFCIFNKQYTKEERYEKVDEIFTQMEKDGTLGQFFPPIMNPFYFNDTAAFLIDPTFTQEEVEKAGYLRRSDPIKVDIPANADLVKISELDQYETFDENGNRTINPAILTKVIQDESGNARRIIQMEYDFLVKYALPLPRKHRLERMKENFKIG